MAAVRFVRFVVGKGCCADDAGAEANGVAAGQSDGQNLTMRALCLADGDGAAKSLLLLGASPEQRAEVDLSCLCWLRKAALAHRR